jgi:hypothetical protein
VKEWKAESRYEIPSEDRVHELFNAVANRKHGVLRWLRQSLVGSATPDIAEGRKFLELLSEAKVRSKQRSGSGVSLLASGSFS